MNTNHWTRRDVVKLGAVSAAGALAGLDRFAQARQPNTASTPSKSNKLTAKADSCIWIWLPGGMAQTDMWDPKVFTPHRAGMKGSEILGTCESIPTAADDGRGGVRVGAGLERIASVMDKGCIVRSLANDVMFGAVHLRAQHYMMTGYIHPAGFKAPSIGSLVGRTLGRRDANVPEYIYIGRDIDTSDMERLFIAEFLGPGFLGVNAAPFMIPDATAGLATLNVAPGMTRERHAKRDELYKKLLDASDPALADSDKAKQFVKMMDDARAMMDSPVKAAFAYESEEKPETLGAYEPRIAADDVMDKSYFNGRRFGHGLLLARRLVERGARFVQVEYQYGPFKGFDMHESGGPRMVEMKKQLDAPIAQLIRDLHERGLLDRTLVVLATEFGRTIASAPSAGAEPEGSAETHDGSKLVIENEKMYGFHGHFSSCSSMVLFGGGVKRGVAHGKTADRHPMLAVENPVKLIDLHATIYHLLGIAPDTSYVSEGRPVYVTRDGKGRAVEALIA